MSVPAATPAPASIPTNRRMVTPVLSRPHRRARSSFLFEHDLFRKPVPTFRDHALRPRRLDSADELLQLVRGVADVLREAADHFERLLRLPDLHQFVDEILVRLQRAQELGEFPPR